MNMLKHLRSPATSYAQLGAARYFRKLLAANTRTPLYLDLLPAAVPALVNCLDRFDLPELQVNRKTT